MKGDKEATIIYDGGVNQGWKLIWINLIAIRLVIVLVMISYGDCTTEVHWMSVTARLLSRPGYGPGSWNMRRCYLCCGKNSITRI